MRDETDLRRVLFSLTRAMRENGYRWYLFEAQAVNVWGTPRLTNDVDVTVEIPEGKSSEAIASLASHGFSLRFEADGRSAIARVLARRFPVALPRRIDKIATR